MAEQQPDDPGVDVGARRFGEQEQAAGLQHAVELGQRFALAREVVEGLVAEDQVDALRRAARAPRCRRAAARPAGPRLRPRRAPGTRARNRSRRCVAARDLEQRTERFALAAADVEHHRLPRPALRRLQAQQVRQRDADHPRLPGAGAEEPEADARLGDEQGLHQVAVLRFHAAIFLTGQARILPCRPSRSKRRRARSAS